MENKNKKTEPNVLYEDEDIVAVDKPAGLITHSDNRTIEPNLLDWAKEKFGDAFIVHRLDRDTSGVMLIAKTQKGFETLKKQFQNHEIKKEYHAFVFGEVKNDTGTIARSIGRSPADFRRWSATRGARGEMREAVTDYEVISRARGYSYVKIFPKTGRTHQIRVHFKAINYPLVGDSLYASQGNKQRENELGFTRTALHSYAVTFRDVKGGMHTIHAPEPEDFAKALKLFA